MTILRGIFGRAPGKPAEPYRSPAAALEPWEPSAQGERRLRLLLTRVERRARPRLPGAWTLLWRQLKAVGLVLAMLAVMYGVMGCAAHKVTRRADGSITIEGFSLFTEKGLAKARVEGVGEIEGWSSRTQEEMFLMLAQLIVARTPVAVPTTLPVR